MAKRVVSIEFFEGGEPNEDNLAQMERTFADLGW
jgi:hypothetical protein